MNVLFDHQAFALQEYGGLSRYFFELIENAKESREVKLDLSLIYSNNEYLDNQSLGKPHPFFPGKKFRGKGRLMMLLNQIYSSQVIRKNDFDILHATYYDTYFLKYLKGKPFTITFLDMIHEKFVSQFPELGIDKKICNNKKLLIGEAPKVITISQATKNDLVDIYGVSADKIDVIHLGSSFNADIGSGKRLHEDPYLLFVGSRSSYKNFKICLEAIADTLKSGKISLVCAGGGDFSQEERDLVGLHGLKHLVKFYKINNSRLANFYKNAEAFIFPSFYEGFGIPVLEAFSCGAPCLLSTGGSLPEVGGDAVLYFDPYDASSITGAVEKVLNDKVLRQELSNKGAERLKLFSWEKTVMQTIEFYHSLI